MFGYIQWNPNPELINIFGLSIRYYGLFFVAGLLLSLRVLRWIYVRENIPLKHLDKLSTYGFVGIVLGARLGHCYFYEPAYYLAHPLEAILPITFLPDGGVKFTGYLGLASHGGALGLILALLYYRYKTKDSLLGTIDRVAVVSGLAAGFIRMANLMNSEIIGKESDKPWAFIFERVDNIPRHPAQLYEAIVYFLIFCVMLFIYKKYSSKLKEGVLSGLVLVLIFTGRFFIEFLKENQVSFEDSMSLNMGQILSLPYIILGIALIARPMLKK